MTIITIKLLSLIPATLAALGAPRLKLNQYGREYSVPDPSALLRVNSLIDEVHDGLPPHLRADADYTGMGLSEDAISAFGAQSRAIRSRILVLRLLLLRPSILAEAQRRTPLVGGKATACVLFRVHLEVCSLCLAAVHTMLEDLHGNLLTAGTNSICEAQHCKDCEASPSRLLRITEHRKQ
jgi:hypothetical protein